MRQEKCGRQGDQVDAGKCHKDCQGVLEVKPYNIERSVAATARDAGMPTARPTAATEKLSSKTILNTSRLTYRIHNDWEDAHGRRNARTISRIERTL
jgi:hypothetical protein